MLAFSSAHLLMAASADLNANELSWPYVDVFETMLELVMHDVICMIQVVVEQACMVLF